MGEGVSWERVCRGRGCVMGEGVLWERVWVNEITIQQRRVY